MKKTLVEFALNILKRYNVNEEFIFTKSGDRYSGISRLELYNGAFNLYEFFKKSGMNTGDKVAIISENRIEWILADFASMFAKMITVPVYTTLSSESIKYIFNNAEVKICFVSNALQLDKVLAIKDEVPSLKKIIAFTETAKTPDSKILTISSILRQGRSMDAEELISTIEQINDKLDEDDVITIIYTSGTTGVPKGVMLTHKNIYSNLVSCSKILPITQDDVFLSYLPYSHIYERTTGYYLPLFFGPKIYYAQSIDTIGVQMAEVKPTFVITVPRLLDKMYNRLLKTYEEMPSGLKKRIFGWGLNVARNEGHRKSSLKWQIADRLVFKKIKEKTGGRLRYFASGGGALNKTVGKFFDGLGIEALEGYGMTETSPVISCNPPGKIKYGTVGTPLEGVEVKIAPDGEILVKGDLVMKGYFNNPAETESTIIDGWLHTGDIGEIDSDGYIRITDRKKSLFKSSGGKYIAPTHIEELIMQLPYVDQVLVIGNERMYVTAIIIPEMEGLKLLAKSLNLEVETESELFQSEILLKKINSDINEKQKDLAPHEKVRKFTLYEKPFTIENGELTPTMKIKRKFVEEKYNYIIEKMYHKV
ncbi:MAG: long-chain fatty acid--CoA ligase [Ignavibacteria bacterium]|nr:long-chain fatty acid--CoA ligase [Ignavibacteria bacterium]